MVKIKRFAIFSFLILLFLNVVSVHAIPKSNNIVAVGWNGEYWLITTMEGGIVKYDGEEFSYLTTLGCIPLEIEWFKDYWIFGCRRPIEPDISQDTLVKYDDEKFVNISADYAPQIIRCNKDHCLMYGSAKDERIMKYNGSKIVDITEEFSKISAVPWINEFMWNGEYWLITTGEELIKYDGNEFIRIGIGNLSIAALGWNGRYWLVVLLEKQNRDYTSRLFKYNESRLEDLGQSLPVAMKKIVWSGNYWLLSTLSNKLIKYDGKTIFEIAPPDVLGISDIDCNGGYCLVSYPVAPDGLRIVRYDGQNYSESVFLSGLSSLRFLGWTGEYWLIETGTPYSAITRLLKYNGSVFTDLTSQYNSILEPPYSVSKPAVSKLQHENPPINYYNVALISIIGLLILFAYLFLKKRNSG